MLLPKIQKFAATFTAAVVIVSLVPSLVRAQVPTAQQQEVQKATAAIATARQLQAIPGEDRKAAVGRPVLFDGSLSTNPLEGTLTYTWDFGDGTSGSGQDITHIYEKSGEYLVTLTVANAQDRATATLKVTIFDKLVVLIADTTLNADQKKDLTNRYGRRGILLSVIEDQSTDPSYLIEENFVKQLKQDTEDLKRADLIVDWTANHIGLDALGQVVQEGGAPEVHFANKAIVVVGSTSKSLAKVAQSSFNVIRPEYILLANDTTMDILVGQYDSEAILPFLSSAAPDQTYRIVGVHSERALSALRPWNFMSYAITYMVNRGVPTSTIILLLMLPIVATFVTFAKQMIGVKAFGIYTPTIITMAFLATGLWYGLIVFFVTLLVGSLTRILLRKLRLLYVPRIAIILSVVSLSILVIFALSAEQRAIALSSIAIFPILILVSLVEKFVNAQIENGFSIALKLSAETLVLSILGYFIVNWETLRVFILAYPEVILLTLVINFALGRWTGLRISEYIRFREIRRYLKS